MPVGFSPAMTFYSDVITDNDGSQDGIMIRLIPVMQ